MSPNAGHEIRDVAEHGMITALDIAANIPVCNHHRCHVMRRDISCHHCHTYCLSGF